MLLSPFGGFVLADKAVLALSGYLLNENAGCCMLLNEWTWLSARVCLIWLKFSLSPNSETKICIEGMHLLKVELLHSYSLSFT